MSIDEPYFSISFEIISMPSLLFSLSLESPFLTSLQVNGNSRSCDTVLSDKKKEAISSSKLVAFSFGLYKASVVVPYCYLFLLSVFIL